MPSHVFIWHRVSALLVFKLVYFLIMSFEKSSRILGTSSAPDT